MISVFLEGQESVQDYKELIRILYKNCDIKYIKKLSDYNNKGYLLYNSYTLNEDRSYTESKLYLDGKELSSKKIYLDSIDVGRDSPKKKLNVAIKKTIVKLSSKVDLPWGILTGIRPTKIIHELNENGVSLNEQRRILREEYLLDCKKISLMEKVTHIQKKYIYPLNNKKYSIYIGIPFCPTKCYYCSFPSVTVKSHEIYMESYIERLIYEIDSTYEYIKDMEINTVYIGGGTPTAIDSKLLGRLIDYIYYRFGTEIKEFTVEAGRPDTLNFKYLKLLKDKNVDRISINPQTMNDDTLNKIGRSHTSRDIVEIYNIAKKLGFKSINMDLIIGLPGEELDHIKNTLNKIEEMNPDNLTVHTLAIKRGSSYKYSEKTNKNLAEKNILDMLKLVEERTSDMNLYPYYLYRQKQILGNFENIGYAKKGFESIYNISMMEEKESILGFGMGSVSKIYSKYDNKIYRVPNFKGLDEYLNRTDELIERKRIAIDKIK